MKTCAPTLARPGMSGRHLYYFFRSMLLAAALILSGQVYLHAQPERKFALLIGVGNYPVESGWMTIHALNDLVVVGDALRTRGFPANQIYVLKDQQATCTGILNYWRKEFLPHIRPGDVVYFQFSGHGQQVADQPGGDEVDGLDEAIVPYDSPLHYEEGVYEGERLIRDDTLNALFTDLRRRLGPHGNLMVVLDACHSGTGTRGMTPARGTDICMSRGRCREIVERPPDVNNTATEFDYSGNMAPMAAFFGSAQHQLNYETQDGQGQLLGSLSYALSKKLSQAAPTTTYRGLFDEIRLEMSAIVPRQQPQAEGMLDQELLGGRLLARPQYFSIGKWDDPETVFVDAGWVHGLNEGAVLGLYPGDTRSPDGATPLARGTVTRVFPTRAKLTLDRALPSDTALGAWAYVLEQNLGELRIGFSIKLPDKHPVRQALLKKMGDNPLFNADVPELFLLAGADSLLLLGQGDALLDGAPNTLSPEVAAHRIMDRIQAYARAKYLRLMEVQSAVLNVDFEIVPVELNLQTLEVIKTLPLDSKRDAQGNVHFKNNDIFKLRITNHGSKTAYFTLIDIYPNNDFRIIIPDEDSPTETPSEFRLEPGQSMFAPRPFQIGPPAGVEMFKLLATEQPIDLRPISRTRGVNATRSASLNPLEKLFAQTYFNDDIRSRGGQTVNLNAGSIRVTSYTFVID